MKMIEGAEISSLEKEIFSLMNAVYEHSKGEYPALEWVKDKPIPGDTEWEKRFEEIYRPFLRYRLKEDVDILLTIGEGEIAGIIGIKHTGTGSFKGYKRLFSYAGIDMPKNAAFLEMLAVHPKYRGKGYGKALLERALGIVEERGMRAYGVSFPRLQPALSIYESIGANITAEVHGYSWSDGEEPADYVIIQF